MVSLITPLKLISILNIKRGYLLDSFPYNHNIDKIKPTFFDVLYT